MSDVTPVTSQETHFTFTRQWGKLISGETERESLGPTGDREGSLEIGSNWGKMIFQADNLEQISGLCD